MLHFESNLQKQKPTHREKIQKPKKISYIMLILLICSIISTATANSGHAARLALDKTSSFTNNAARLALDKTSSFTNNAPHAARLAMIAHTNNVKGVMWTAGLNERFTSQPPGKYSTRVRNK